MQYYNIKMKTEEYQSYRVIAISILNNCSVIWKMICHNEKLKTDSRASE